jgi:hypothetical protein
MEESLGLTWERATYTNVDTRPDEIQPGSSSQADGMGCGKVPKQLPCLAVIYRQDGTLKVAVRSIGLSLIDLSIQLRSKTLFDSRLCPVDAEVPVPLTCCGRLVLFEDDHFDTGLTDQGQRLSPMTRESSAVQVSHPLEDMSHQEPGGPYLTSQYQSQNRGYDILLPPPITSTRRASEALVESMGGITVIDSLFNWSVRYQIISSSISYQTNQTRSTT